MLKEKRESEGRGGGSLTLSFPPTSPRGRQDRIESERTSVKKRERERERKERASKRARNGCCCCGRGITSAPLTRKTFRLNLVLDSARLLSTHPNRPAFLARPKRSANLTLPFSPTVFHTLQVLPDRCRTTAEPPVLLIAVHLTPFRSYQHK